MGDLERPLVFPQTHRHEGAAGGFLGRDRQRSRGTVRVAGFTFPCVVQNSKINSFAFELEPFVVSSFENLLKC